MSWSNDVERSSAGATPARSPLRTIRLNARYRADEPAIVDDSESVTYGQLWDRVASHASTLRSTGIEQGTPVVTDFGGTVTAVALILAIMHAGAVAVPVNPGLKKEELRGFIEPLGLCTVVADPEQETLAGMIDLERSGTRIGMHLAEVGRIDGSVVGARLDSALVLGTGGTTGLPKGSIFSHRALDDWTLSAATINGVRADDVELFVAPFYHGTLVTGLITTLSAGGCVRLCRRFDAHSAVEEIERGSITRMLGASTVMERLLVAADGKDMSSTAVRFLQFGMSSSRPGFAGRLQEAFPRSSIITGYGATEFGPVTRTYSWEFGTDGEPIGVGRPVPRADIGIEIGGTLTTEPAAQGEIVVTCPWQMQGYCSRELDGDTTSRFGEGLRSGDVGCFDADGFLHLTGRLKETIRTGGENVYPGEVESALFRHPSVASCAAYGVPDADWGERVEVAVQLHSGDSASEAELYRHLRTQIAGFKVPKRIRIMAQLPYTAASKVDRRALRDAVLAEEAR